METLRSLCRNVNKKYPGIEIVGAYSPPFRELTPEEDERAIKWINGLGADFMWVGLGAPKQEIYMAKHQGKINALMIGVGAGFAYHAGKLKRAPKWMQEHNLEWFFRLLQEPGKLLGRYGRTNAKFLWNACVRGK